MASNPIATITEDLSRLRETFVSIAPKSVNFDKETGFAIQVLNSNDYALRIAMGNRQSVIDAVNNIAAIGISLNPAKRQAYLVPRKRKICLDISYMGLIDLAVETGSILWAQANVVRLNDKFVLNGFDKPPSHEHDPFSSAENRGGIVGAYVVVKTHDGQYLTHTMDIKSIYDIRDRSEAWKAYVNDTSKTCPWVTDEVEMIKKTVVKQAYKYWPKTDRSTRLDEAIKLLNSDNGEGFAPINSGTMACPAEVLNEWIKKAHDAKTSDALKQVWKNGLAIIRPYEDRDAYSKFKNTVHALGVKFKNGDDGDVTDVQPKGMPTPPTLDGVLAAMDAATTREDLDLAADAIRSLPEEDRQTAGDAYDNLLATKFKFSD